MINGVNTLTQEMLPLVSGGNTIYVIRYDFALGENITIPDNSILEFDGGSITAGNGVDMGTVSGRNTSILAGLVKIFSPQITLAGTWKVEYGHPEWFGAKGDGISNDTEAFYSTLLNFNAVFLRGQYSIDFRDVDISNKAIVGKWRTNSAIIQRNSNVPFALVKTYSFLNRFTFRVKNNTKITDVLHFGYSNENYNKFSSTDITNIVFDTNSNTIPLHFNMQHGGNSDCFVENVRIYHCYIGIWYEFHKTYSDVFGWLTQCSMKDVTIYDPVYYGFKWDALSMYDQGKSVDGKTIQTMWCYNNYFENIGIDIIKDGATGFYIGQGMGMLVNPMVFNDIPATQPNAVGYSVEFAPIGSPVRPKMVTNIIGGSFEGQVKNMDYAYMNNIKDLRMTFRDNRGSTDRFTTLDSSSIPDAYDFNLFGKDVLNNFVVKNATLNVGSDEFGEYLKITRIDPTIESYFGGGTTKTKLINNGVKNGLYTLHTIAQSNLGELGTGFYFQYPGYKYTIDGQSGESILLGKDGKCIGNNVFVKVSDEIKDRFVFGYYFEANSNFEWVKIYSMRLMPGIVGKYLMEKPGQPRKETITISRTYSVDSGLLKLSASFSTLDEVTNKSCPISIQCEGHLSSGVIGTIVTVGKLPCYNTQSKIVFPIYNTENGAIVGICFVETDGTFKFKYTTSIEKMISIYGSA